MVGETRADGSPGLDWVPFRPALHPNARQTRFLRTQPRHYPGEGAVKISAKLAMIISAIFAIACFGVAITGFTSSADIADPALRADGWGYAWFWAFLGMIGIVFGALSYWMVRTSRDE